MIRLSLALAFIATHALAAPAEPTAYFNQNFVKAVSGQSKDFNDQTWFQQLKKEYPGIKALRLSASGESLCWLSGAAKLCWHPTANGEKSGIVFEAGTKKKIFYPTHPADFQKSVVEFVAFAKAQKAAFVPFEFLISSAYAEEGSGLTREKVDLSPMSGNKEAVKVTFPGVVVASLQGWRYLPKEISSVDRENFVKDYKQRFKGFERAGRISCAPIQFTKKVSKSNITVNFGKSGYYDVEQVAQENGNAVKRKYRASLREPSSDSISCKKIPYLPFVTGHCEFNLPKEVLFIGKCDPKNKDACETVSNAYASDYDPFGLYAYKAASEVSGDRAGLEAYHNALENSQNAHHRYLQLQRERAAGPEALEKAKEESKKYDEAKIATLRSLDEKFYNTLNEWQDIFMRMEELKRACADPVLGKLLSETRMDANEAVSAPAGDDSGKDAQ